MPHARPSRHLLALTLLAGIASAELAFAQAQPLQVPSVDGLAPNGWLHVEGLSADGRFVAISSQASNLVSDDTVRCGIRSCTDVFVLDRDTDADGVFDEPSATAIVMVSRTSDGAPALDDSFAPSISADGRYVAFTSGASNLQPPGASSFRLQAFVHDRQTRLTGLVSVSSTGAIANEGTDYYSAVLSANGRVVAFRSMASNLVPGDTNGNCLSPPNCSDVFVRDLTAGTTTRVNVSTNGAQADRESYHPSLSADGRVVVFSSDATTLVTGDANGFQDVFVHDTLTAITERLSVTSDGREGDAPSYGPVISANGQLVVFTSDAANLPAGPAHDRTTGRAWSACAVPAGAGVPCRSPSLSADARWLVFAANEGIGAQEHILVRDLQTRHSADVGPGFAPTISGDGCHVAFNTYVGPFVVDLDGDDDGLPDSWEGMVGLDATSGEGDDGADGDADRDGVTNEQEYAEGTHPRGFVTRYFAEGATGAFFDTRLALLNPSPAVAHVQLRFMRADGTTASQLLTLPELRRVTIDANTIPDLAAAEFSIVIDSDIPVVIDRTMAWNQDGYGAHAETSVEGPAATWYLAEGATHSGFQLFYLLQNPGPSEATVRVRYLRPDDAPLEKAYVLPPTSRTNIWVNVEAFPGLGAALASTEVSAVITSVDSMPIVVERAMYLSNDGRVFNAGHESAGVTAPQLEWFLAEGATGAWFDMFVLIANPHDVAADVRVTYLLADGQTLSRTLTAPAESRSSIWVDHEQFDGIAGLPLADVAVSTKVEVLNGVPIIVERAMWWPGSYQTWHESHNSAGVSEPGLVWALAEGEVDGARGAETYVLIANTSAFAGQALVTVVFEEGTSTQRTYTLAANSRTNVAVGHDFGTIVNGRRFGVLVESLGPGPAEIVVERAMYWDAGGERWAAGTNAPATRLK